MKAANNCVSLWQTVHMLFLEFMELCCAHTEIYLIS